MSDGQGEPGREQRVDSIGKSIFSGLSWNSIGQLTSVAVGIVLTPFLVLRLGLDRYGLFALVSSVIGVLSNLDGGFGASTLRFFSVHVGGGERGAESRLLVTASLLLAVGAGALGAVVGVLAPSIVVHFHAPHQLYGQAALILRLLVPVVVVSMWSDLLQALLAAHNRWRTLGLINIGGQLFYAALAFSLVGAGYGMIGLVCAFAGGQLIASVASLLTALRFVDLSSCRLMSWRETCRFWSYASKIQVALIASEFNVEFPPLIIGLLLPIRFVALYAIGANFALQLRTIPTNALEPIQVSLSQTFGRAGLQPTLDQHRSIQKVWTRTVTAVPLVGAALAWFAISRWLGANVAMAGAVAAILLVGHASWLLTSPLNPLDSSVGRPDIERDDVILSACLTAALAVVLALVFGVLGVATAVALAEVLGSVWFLRASRRRISPHLQSCFAGVPWLAVACSALLGALLELPAYWISPAGPAGLLVCAIPAIPALGCYAVMVEPRLALSLAVLARRREGRAEIPFRRPAPRLARTASAAR